MARILVVDDDPAYRKIVSMFLSRAGYEVESVSNGIDAVHVAGRWKPDLAILDIMMPRKGGVEATIDIRQANPALPVIFMTGKSEEETAGLERFAQGYGVQHVLHKPMEKTALLTAVSAILSGV